ncbi:hypothetical protein IQ268_22250 [Oculatella sp. LEGE 06141]|uniref:bestrophin family protein n=1 Tax=Oculatella sp. LEGE 06141 TaxID=1828648 RepID=UPI0018818776|nr:bestrophin family ion channel [Oculatella sp. LEGE 06141]MBE9181286.1 hypothetical protein [Oculatella sp. LEGE 06141]
MAEKINWFFSAMQLRGSVFPIILPRILLFGILGFLVSAVYYFELPIEVEDLGEITNNVAFNLVLGLLLVFRTNTAYDRFWEGRKAWGTFVINIRNLAREIQTSVSETDQLSSLLKDSSLRLLPAFAIVTKLHLRQEPLNQELLDLVTPSARDRLSQAQNPPLEVTLWLGNNIEQLYKQGHIDPTHRLIMSNQLSNLIEGLTTCERILKTPVPVAYGIYLKRLLLIYCGLLPFNLVDILNWWTGFAVALISFVLLGIEEIGNEIETPFGSSSNDLPLDELCQTVRDNVERTRLLTPGDRSFPTLGQVTASDPQSSFPATPTS